MGLETDAADAWRDLVRNAGGTSPCAGLATRMREQRLTFGGRLLCPFLRPFFLTADDEQRVRHAAEGMWTLGERVAAAALERPELFAELGLSEEEVRLVLMDPGYAMASTAARADAFLLPDSLQFAEYNAESPAGAGYSQRLAEVFANEPLMRQFGDRFEARHYSPIPLLLDALVASYRDWGGTASPPQIAIVDWRGVPTWSEFELLRDAFVALGVPTVIADPRDLTFDGGRLVAAGVPIDLVYRRVLMNDIVARADECRTLTDAYERQAVCVANTFRCKIAHKKAFFAVLTDDRFRALFSAPERAMIHDHIPWTRVVRDGPAVHAGRSVDLLEHLRARRERFVIKPNDEYGGTGVALGWEQSEQEWDQVIQRAVSGADGTWIAQERIAIRREIFPVCEQETVHERDMLVDFAPYLFRGRLAGFLTRLSATGLANVTSGGGQVPAFVVRGR
jgi:uncharacterized circularly permuted ATP-grasp superfamily protein